VLCGTSLQQGVPCQATQQWRRVHDHRVASESVKGGNGSGQTRLHGLVFLLEAVGLVGFGSLQLE
jgi:hypothetical protein